MKMLHDYLRTAVMLVALLAGVQLPAVVHQYGMLLEARVQESSLSLQPFQRDADRYFGGDLDQLIRHYHNQSDPVFVAGGESIETLLSRHRSLTRALAHYRNSTWEAYFQTLVTPVPEIRTQLWRDYQYSITLNPGAIGAGVIFALLCRLLLDMMVWTGHQYLQRVRRHTTTKPDTAPGKT